MSSFKKASELLNSSNDTVTINELKGRLTHLENNQLSEIHKSLSKSSNKETFDRPCIETLQKYVSSTKPKNTNKNTLIQTKDKKKYKANSLYNGICAINPFYQEMFKDREPFNIHEDFKFRIVRDTLHTRMIELEEINNSEYNGADPLTDEEMVKIFKQFDISSNSPDGLLRRVFLWVGCCTACRGGSYHSIMASHFKKHEPGTYGACHDIRKYLSLRPNNNAEETFFFVLIKILKV
uniref:Uncharacterized protein n=1 Tax=Rhizophagus irregularis (strain DAOM 181602 / DAOM 197198 / MUCL 43194) TaxID=747089 RepID=U9T7R8_RHIID